MTIADHIQQTLETKPIPAALVAAFLFQIAGGLYWAGTAAERISVLEGSVARDQSAIEHVAVLESEATTMHAQLVRIEAKLDRLQERVK